MTFMHAKYAIIDDKWFIGTSNWTRSSFSRNRELILSGNQEALVKSLEEIFVADFQNIRLEKSYHNSLLVGPGHAREQLVKIFATVEKEVMMYAPSLTDEIFIDALDQLCQSGVSVRILLAYEDALPKKPCLRMKIISKPHLHAKGLIYDGDRAFVGSFNFTKNSLEENREIGIFFQGPEVKTVKNIFEIDWNAAKVAP